MQIQDETNKNIEVPIKKPVTKFWDSMTNQIKEILNRPTPEQKALEEAKKIQKEQWAREDEIRKHIEEREDSAWTRSVRDMINAGINPNLMNVQPAASGGGITTATGVDYSMYEAEMNKQLELIKQEIQNKFQGEQKEKDRIVDSITRLIQLAGVALLKK